MEVNLIREYKGYQIVEIGPYVGKAIEERTIVILTQEGKQVFSNNINITDPTQINKKVERAKEWIDYKIANPDERMCRVCGCRELNCLQCIDKTGDACIWVDIDLCSACVNEQQITSATKHINSSNNSNDMEFFSKLAAIGNVDITLRIMQKNDKLTMEINPGSNKAAGIKPSIITGTGADLDENFFSTVFPAVKEIEGIVSTLKDVKIQAQQKADKKRVSDDKPAKKETKKHEKKSTAKPVKKTVEKTTPVKEDVVADEPSLFNEPVEAE